MTVEISVKQSLIQAETSLSQVGDSLASAEPGALASGERRLIDLVETMCRIERAVRLEPSLAIRESLLNIRNTLGQTRKLSTAALRTIATHIETRNLCVPTPSSKLCVEG